MGDQANDVVQSVAASSTAKLGSTQAAIPSASLADVNESCSLLREHMEAVPGLAASCAKILDRSESTESNSILSAVSARARFLRYERSTRVGMGSTGLPQPSDAAAGADGAPTKWTDSSGTGEKSRCSASPRIASLGSVDGSPSFFNSSLFQFQECHSVFVKSLMSKTSVVENPAALHRLLYELKVDDLFGYGEATFGAYDTMSCRQLPRKPQNGSASNGGNAVPFLDHSDLKTMQNRQWAIAEVKRGVRFNDERAFKVNSPIPRNATWLPSFVLCIVRCMTTRSACVR